MVTLEQATEMFEKMVAEYKGEFRVFQISEVQFDDPIYVMVVLDDKGKQWFPGDKFPSIRKLDGALVDFSFPPPA